MDAPPAKGFSRTNAIIALGSLVASSLAVLVLWMFVSADPDPSEKLEIAIRKFRRGDHATAARIAKGLQEAKLKQRTDVSKREFLIGAEARIEAQSVQLRRTAIERNEFAVEHLLKSRRLQFPTGYEGYGNYLLGKALFDLFRLEEAKTPLQTASDRYPQGRCDAMESLIDIELFGKESDLPSAIRHLENWESVTQSSPYDEDRIAIKKMEILFAQGRLNEAEPIVKKIATPSPFRPAANLILARVIHQKAREARGPARESLLRDVLQVVSEIESSASVPIRVRRRAMLERGTALRDLGLPAQAVSTLSMLRQSSPYEPECLVAAIEEIASLIDLERFDEAAATLKHLSNNFGELRWYQDNWQPLAELRTRLLESCNRVLEKSAFESSSKLAETLPPICDETDRLRLKGLTYDRWARAKKKEADATSSKKQNFDELASGRMRTCFHTAAEALERLSNLQLRSPDYFELLWLAIEDYRESNDFRDSNRLIDRYLSFSPRDDQAKGLLLKALNYASIGEPNQALASLNKIILTIAESPLVYDAKLEAARLHAAQEDYDRAEQLIIENLYYGDLRPESPIWRESLLELGMLLYTRGERLQAQSRAAIFENPSQTAEYFPKIEQSFDQLVKGVSHIEEGLRRFSKDPRRFQLLYTTAKAYRLASFWPDLLLRENRAVSEDAANLYKSQRKELLTKSRDTFAKLREEINATGESVRVEPNMKELLRNSYFGEADLLFHEGDFQAALAAYRDTATRFNNEPESLEALVQMARCQEELKQINEMRRTLEMARDALNRIPKDQDERFKVNTRQDRHGWEKFIQWMIDAIDRNHANVN